MKRKMYEAIINRLTADTLEAYTLIEELLENPTQVSDPLAVLVEEARQLAQSEGALLTIKSYFDKKVDGQAETAFLRRKEMEKYDQLHQLIAGIESHLRPAALPPDSTIRVITEDMSPTFKRSQKDTKKEEPDEEE
jgi:hypothetical protein